MAVRSAAIRVLTLYSRVSPFFRLNRGNGNSFRGEVTVCLFSLDSSSEYSVMAIEVPGLWNGVLSVKNN